MGQDAERGDTVQERCTKREGMLTDKGGKDSSADKQKNIMA